MLPLILTCSLALNLLLISLNTVCAMLPLQIYCVSVNSHPTSYYRSLTGCYEFLTAAIPKELREHLVSASQVRRIVSEKNEFLFTSFNGILYSVSVIQVQP